MTSALLLWMACEAAVPLPPKAMGPPAPNARMVQAGDVQGYLVQPVATPSPIAVLLLVEDMNDQTRSEAKSHPNSTVLAIEPATSLDGASAYLRGLANIDEVRIICKRKKCSEDLGPGHDPVHP